MSPETTGLLIGIAISVLVFAVGTIIAIREHGKLKRRIERIAQEVDQLDRRPEPPPE